MRKMKRFLAPLLMLILAAPAGAVSLEEEIQVGRNAHKIVTAQFQVLQDKELQKYVSEVGNKMLTSMDDPQFDYTFTVLAHPMINAFALPGGYVYVTTGMLSYLDSEAALAALLGHEIGHVRGHHSYKQMEKSMGETLLVFAGLAGSIASGQGSGTSAAVLMAGSSITSMNRLGYGRALEVQADEMGMLYAHAAGYDPRESYKMFETLRFKETMGGVEYHGFVATHPDTRMRIIEGQEKSSIIANRGGPLDLRREQYLKKVQGMPWGKKTRGRKYDPAYRLVAYTAKEGDSFRSIAAEVAGDEGLAFEVAVMNAMRPGDALPTGKLIKVPMPKDEYEKTYRTKDKESLSHAG